ncbi:unnamed protein product [Scytosiphon promiscuus]
MGYSTSSLVGFVVAAASLASAPPCAEAYFVAPLGGTSRAALAGQQHQRATIGSGSSGRSHRQRRTVLGMKYVPDGLTPEQWKKMQKEEADKKKKMGDLGQVGVKSFKSRSLQAWQEAGAGHLFPVDPAKVKSGEISAEETPYMQRKGAWDNSDLAKKEAKAQQKKATTAAQKKTAASKQKKTKAQPTLEDDGAGKKKGLFGLW